MEVRPVIRTTWTAALVMAIVSIGQHLSAAEIEIGAAAPDFKAQGVDGKEYSLKGNKGKKATVVCFTCNLCPVAVAYEDRFNAFAKQYADKGIAFIAINCNKSEDVAAMKKRAEEKGFVFPYVFDASGDSARGYGARVTPHVFVVDQKGNVVYRGSFDDKQQNPTRAYVEDAVKAVLAGKTPETQTTKAFGCGIKID